jgi:hypothetical protein
MLDGAISLASFSRRVGRERLIALCKEPRADGNVHVCRTTTAGTANVRLFRGSGGEDDGCRRVADSLGGAAPRAWREEFVVGPHCAGLANAAFAMPRALLFELRGLNRKGDPFDHERELSQTRRGHGPALRVPRRNQRIGYRSLDDARRSERIKLLASA